MPASPGAPPEAISQRPPQSVFPPDPPAQSVRSRLYHGYRHEFAGVRITRWCMIALVPLALVWTLLLSPWWLGAVLTLVVISIFGLTIARYRRQSFVSFREMTTPHVDPSPLSPQEKVAIYATGTFSVEDNSQRFTFLPGFARTFITGEHAFLCLARDRRYAGIGRWPETEVGMWYIFIQPESIRDIRVGSLNFTHETPAIAVSYRASTPSTSSGKTQSRDQTLYLVCVDPNDTQRLLADLQAGRSST